MLTPSVRRVMTRPGQLSAVTQLAGMCGTRVESAILSA